MSRANELVYAALGGAGEIGMNMYLYGFGPESDRRWVVVDCGVTFGDMTSSPGVELVLPDIDFIVAERKSLEGIFITHAHEDHVGGLARLWRRLRAPVYCTPFTAEIARRKFEEVGLSGDEITIVAPRQAVKAGPFEVSFFPVTHSIPQAMSLVIRTPLGVLYHSADFKLDPEPLIGPATDEAALAKIGDEGVLCLTCDSTNVFEEGLSGSEAGLRANLTKIMRDAEGAVAATTFASNVARLRTLAEAARAADRSIVVAGRAMQKMIEAAIETKAIPDFPDVISAERAQDLPSRHVLYLVTGSQGEGRAALARIAGDTHPVVSLAAGDLVIFSSRMIPGNERDVLRVYNRLSERGVRVIDADMADIHVSGHAYRGELRRLYELLKPAIAIPQHGEHRHLVEHARLAREWGAGDSLVAPNGTLVRIASDGDKPSPQAIGFIDAGRVYLDGKTMVGALDGVIRNRLRMARQGHVSVALVVDGDGELITDAEVRCLGLPEDGDDWPAPLNELIAEAVEDAVEGLKKRERASDSHIEEVATQVTRRTCDRYWGKKPEVTAMVIRLDEDDLEIDDDD